MTRGKHGNAAAIKRDWDALTRRAETAEHARDKATAEVERLTGIVRRDQLNHAETVREMQRRIDEGTSIEMERLIQRNMDLLTDRGGYLSAIERNRKTLTKLCAALARIHMANGLSLDEAWVRINALWANPNEEIAAVKRGHDVVLTEYVSDAQDLDELSVRLGAVASAEVDRDVRLRRELETQRAQDVAKASRT